jgi:hypothetical protein
MTQYPIQSARTIASRAMCLGALLKRHGLEQGMHSVNDLPDEIREGWKHEHKGIHQHLKAWCIEEKLTSHFSKDEQLLIDATLGDWQHLDLAAVKWRGESLGMMLWALGIIEVPYYDMQFDTESLLDPLDLMNPTIDFMWQADVIDGKFIQKARDLAELWYERAQFEEEQRNNPSGRDDELEVVIRTIAGGAYEDGNLPELIDDDFPVLGKAYHALDDEEYEKLAPIAKERLYALNWLCQYSDDWDSVPLKK